jgi:hypothetical protein
MAKLHLSVTQRASGEAVVQTPDGPAVLLSSLELWCIRWLAAAPLVSSSTGPMKRTLFSRMRQRSKVDRGTVEEDF